MEISLIFFNILQTGIPDGPPHFSNERYLVNQLRKRFGFVGTPIELKIRGRAKKKDSPALK
jgi:predicted GTPase